MRRTLFVFPTVDVPLIQAAVSTPLAVVLSRQLASRIRRNGTDPEIDGSAEAWLTDVETSVELSLRVLGAATGAQLGMSLVELDGRFCSNYLAVLFDLFGQVRSKGPRSSPRWCSTGRECA